MYRYIMLLDNILYFMYGIHLLYCSLFQPKNVPVCAIFDVIMYVSIVNDLFHITCVMCDTHVNSFYVENRYQ